MGRAKLNMELISKEKSRNITFKKRKEGLIRKMHEFTTLCDVSACMIIYGPKQDKGGSNDPEIWPQNLDEVRRIIDIYKSKNKDSGNKTFGLSDFFHDRKRKIEDELAKLRKKNMEAKYPTWLEFMNSRTEPQLRQFAAALSNKAEYVRSRIEFLKRSNKEGFSDMNMNNINMLDFALSRLSQSHSFYSPGVRGIELEVINQQAIHYPTIDHHQELHSLNQNSMMMLLMNDNDHCVQFGAGASTSGNIQCAASFKDQAVFYESMAAVQGVVDPMICHSPRPLARYYAPPVLPAVQVPPTSYMQCAAPPQLELSARENNDGGGQEEFVQYQMKNNWTRYYD
ncbi:Agamous-like MADS-box protein [Sesamum alatum]|uniref:Agamous-like MADS-box protein n=1 Tax=Sesamum alatum TaxID=300844 RepID=A0AAE1YZ43_9LAMI|nr:Agamous-like MADS-box protein [Sesamum alatum]